MTKEIKKCYYYLDLPFNATVEQVKVREKVMIKILRAKGMKLGKSYKDEINKVVLSAEGIFDYIKKNGIPKEKEPTFDTSISSLTTQIVAMLVMLIFCVLSFVALLWL